MAQAKRFSGKVWKYGDDVNTDVIFAGKYTYTIKDRAEMAKVALEDLDPGAGALDDLDVDLDGVTGPEVRDVGALHRVAELGDDVAHVSPRECHRSAAVRNGSVGCPASSTGGAVLPLWQEPVRTPSDVSSGDPCLAGWTEGQVCHSALSAEKSAWSGAPHPPPGRRR